MSIVSFNDNIKCKSRLKTVPFHLGGLTLVKFRFLVKGAVRTPVMVFE